MIRATVHVDLANKSCVITSGDTQHGQWSGVTRSTTEAVISRDGWTFAPGSDWTLTVDGGVREVVLIPAVAADDRLLDRLGSANPSANLLDDELNVLLLAWRRDVDTEPARELVNTTTDLTVLATARTELAYVNRLLNAYPRSA